MKISEDADFAGFDHMLAEAGEVARPGAAGIDRGRDPGPAAEIFSVDAERGAAPVDVGVQVDQSRRNDGAGDVAHVGIGIALQSGADARHLALRERDVGHRVELLRRIDDPAAAQNEVIRHAGISVALLGQCRLRIEHDQLLTAVERHRHTAQ
jgi:hypothetical protein